MISNCVQCWKRHDLRGNCSAPEQRSLISVMTADSRRHAHGSRFMRKKLRARKKIERDIYRKRQKTLAEKETYTPDKVFKYEHFIKSAAKSEHGVSWKASVQLYMIYPISRTYGDHKRIKAGKVPKCYSGREVAIVERGKTRIITPIHIKDRVVQKVLCTYALLPVFTRKLIYDNGASLKGKGVGFTRERMEKHLKRAARKFGQDFYVMTFDFKNFFGSIPHKLCRKILERYFSEDLAETAMEIIKNPLRGKARKLVDRKEAKRRLKELTEDRACGICLGSEESQDMALIVPNDIDHYIKDVARVKLYSRYMDDGVLFAKTKEELQDIYEAMKQIADGLGLRFNEKKTRIAKARKGFTFMKVKYRVTKTGKIVKRLTRKGIIRMRRKLKKFKRKMDRGEITIRNVYDSFQSWRAHAKVADSYRTVKNMTKLYIKLFGGESLRKGGKAGCITN